MRIGLEINELFSGKEKNGIFDGNFSVKKLLQQPVNQQIIIELNKICAEGNQLILVFPAIFEGKKTRYKNLVYYIILNWIKKIGISSAELEFYSGDKVVLSINERLDAIITSDREEDLSQVVDIIYLGSNIQGPYKNSRMHTIESVTGISETITKIQHYKNIKITDPIKPLSGLLSIDKPYLKNYTLGQLDMKVPEMSPHDYLFYQNRFRLRKNKMHYMGNAINYQELQKLVDRCCDGFKKMGVQPGDVVSLCMADIPECIICWAALGKMGAVANMIHPLLGENEVKECLKSSHSKVLVMIDIAYNNVRNIIDETEVENVIVTSPKDSMPGIVKNVYSSEIYLSILYQSVFGSQGTNIVKLLEQQKNTMVKKNPERAKELEEKIKGFHKAAMKLAQDNLFYKESPTGKYIRWNLWMKKNKPVGLESVPYNPEQTSTILQSGGSGGIPKSVEICGKSFITEVEQFRKVAGHLFNENDVMLIVMPFFHGFGLISSFYITSCLGVECVIMPKLDMKQLEKIVKKQHITVIAGVPTLLRAILNHPEISENLLPYLKLYISGGSPLDVELLEELKKQSDIYHSPVEIWNGYGQTETSTGVTLETNPYCEVGSIGIPNIGNLIKIVKPGTHEEVAYGEAGELCVSGDTIMKGILNNLEETLKKRQLHEDGHIWIHTGDIMKWNQEKGRLVYVDRIDDMIISSGYNVYPSDIARVIGSHPAVQTCIVGGMESEYKGSVPVAYIVLKPNVNPTKNLKEELLKLCEKNMPKYSLPAIMEFVDELPQTSIGKVRVKEIKIEPRAMVESN